MLSKTTLTGYAAEQGFKSTVENLGFDVVRPPGVYDRLEHWDLHLMLKVDVKAMKKLNRRDNQAQDGWHWLEIKGVCDDGWIYGSKANVIAFETINSWILVRIEALKDLINRAVSKEYVDTAAAAKYKLYSRRNDIITLVETDLLKTYGWEIPK